jgi:matrixin
MKRFLFPSLTMATLLATAALVYVVPGYSYLAESSLVNGQLTGDHWPATAFPVRWQINNAITLSGANPAPNYAGTPNTAETAIVNGFNAWVNAPNTSLSVNAPTVNTAITDAKQIPPNVNFVCFICSGGNFGKDGTLAVTSTFSTSGQITQAYILFNPNPTTGGTSAQPICFTIAGDTNCPTPTAAGNQQDLQTVATHEIGHFFGLDHSAVVRAMMFPQAPPIQLALSYDDVAGISSLYPSSSPGVPTGSISGMVSMPVRGGVFGAHVIATSTTSATDSTMAGAGIRKSPIGTLTRPDGTYTIAGLPADSYLVIAEPLDGPASDSDMDWGTTFNQSIFTGFTTRWH